MSRAWGGLVPDDSQGPHDAGEQFREGEGAPQGVAGAPAIPPAPPTAQEQANAELVRHSAHLERLEHYLRRHNTPAQLAAFQFNGASAPPIFQVWDDHGLTPALSIAIINPTALHIYLGLAGQLAAPNSGAFVVSPTSAIVLPVEAEKVPIGVDPLEIGANSATIFRLRYPTVQPFFLGAM